MHFLRDEGDAGGTPVAGEAEPNAGTAPNDNAAAAPESGGEQKGAEKGDGGSPSLEEQLKTANEAHAKLKKEFGDQANQLGELRRQHKTAKSLIDKMQADPTGFLKEFAKRSGAKIDFGDGPKGDLSGVFSDDADASAKAGNLDKYLDAKVNAMLRDRLGALMPMVETLQEQDLARKYETWDADKEARDVVLAAIHSNAITPQEAAQLVVQAQRIPEALEAAKAAGREEAEEVWRKKYAELAEAPGGGGEKPEGDKPKSPEEVGMILRDPSV